MHRTFPVSKVGLDAVYFLEVLLTFSAQQHGVARLRCREGITYRLASVLDHYVFAAGGQQTSEDVGNDIVKFFKTRVI